VLGAPNFAAPVAGPRARPAALAPRLPGYLVPRFVREIPGERGKTPL
jgi:L-lysine 2,3-aminomutase